MVDQAVQARVRARFSPGAIDAFDAAQSTRGTLDHWLTSGGDSRLRLGALDNLNDYGCSPLPRPQTLSFASSTASSISERAFAAAEHAWRALRGENRFAGDEDFVETMRSELKAVWGLGEETDVVFAPSGTDAELRALFLAKSALKPPAVAIIVDADETGSGVPFAASGRHFNSETANGFSVVKGEPIGGLAGDVSLIAIPARGADGETRPLEEVDAAVHAAAENAIAAGNSVILHVMSHSKLGSFAPTPECVGRIAETFRGKLQVIVDACQARISRARVRAHLARDRIVLITGSKFFTGPAFSGAVLAPTTLSARAAASRDIPIGFLKYTCACDWPSRFAHLRGLLPPTINLGQTLRWSAALEEMRSYFGVPAAFREFAFAEFADFARRCLSEQPNLRVLEPPSPVEADEEFSIPSVFSFLALRHGRPLSMRETRVLYRALNEDLSAVVCAETPGQRRLLAQTCHIGQPVAIPQAGGEGAGALRIAADARMISQSWFGGDEADAAARFRARLETMRIVCGKLAFLLDRLDELATA